jgi:hypothetical protein
MVMTYQGTVQNGVVVLADGVTLPEGTQVSVVPVIGTSEAPPKGGTTIWQKMADLAEWVETQPCDLPGDLADNHDHYLHGLPKR